MAYNNYDSGYRRSEYSQNRREYNRNSGETSQQSLNTTPHIKLNDSDYVDIAEKIINELNVNNGKDLLSTSKIRSLLSMISSLYDEVRRSKAEKLSAEAMSQIQYIRLHFAYEAGRDNKVKAFVIKADILRHINDIHDSKGQFMLFCRYLEALVAYHRFVGGSVK